VPTARAHGACRRRGLAAGRAGPVYRGGHLDLIAEPHRLAPVIERFLRAGAFT
jgi:hypothetical protein